jgi:putative Ca2+/H+ antiporter (TMEM165/GDT1 family)
MSGEVPTLMRWQVSALKTHAATRRLSEQPSKSPLFIVFLAVGVSHFQPGKAWRRAQVAVIEGG